MEQKLRVAGFDIEVEDVTPKRTRRGIRKLVDDKPKVPMEPLDLPLSWDPPEDPSDWKEIIIDSTMKIQYNHHKVMDEIMGDMDAEFFKKLREDEDRRCPNCQGTGRVRSGYFDCEVCRGTGVNRTCKNCKSSTRPGWIWTGMDNMKWIPCSECNPNQLEPLYPKVPTP